MKQFIVPSDFSTHAEHAMFYAAQLAQKTNAGVVLLHVFQLPVAMSDVPVMMLSADDLKENAEIALEKTKEDLLAVFPSLTVTTAARMGDVSAEVNELSKDIDAFAVVVGRHEAGGIERFFFGSTSVSVVRHTSLPVIVVPEHFDKKQVGAIALAVDDQPDSLPKEKIKYITEFLGAQLHVIHVEASNSETKDFGSLIPGLNTNYTTIHGDEFLHGIQTFLEQTNIDMLMVIPHKHSFVERLSFRTHTEELIRKLTIPIICISEDE